MSSPTPESDREFNELLAAFSERELTGWEHDRLWKLLKESPGRVEQWKEQCRVVALLEHLDEAELEKSGVPVPPANVVSLPGVDLLESSSTRRRTLKLFSAGIAALLVAALFFVFRGGEAEIPVLAESGSAGERTAPEATADPQAVYDEAVVSIPSTASLSRPATKGSTLASSPKDVVDFNNDIRPILADKCFHCHGPDEHSRKADLRLDLEESAFADLGGYAPFVHGDVEASEALLRMTDDDPDSIMPPPEFHKPMTKKEIALITQWVEEGAEWKAHWSFEPTTLTQVDDSVARDPWVKNGIDGYILEKLRAKGLEPNGEADRYALARRAALDLIGLPPTPDELDRFLKDESETAYEDYVDRLLASSHYGEHRARFWLDAARYGDTHGMHLDNFREMWPYRDWVIEAFNRNLPFDQFATEQLAGDLLENPTRDQLIATGFNRNHITTAEGGAIPAELAVRYMVDRTETMSTVFLGLTTGCASCHDHKYDPISQKEFYSLAAFFNNSNTPAMDGNMRDHYPTLVVPKEEHAAEWEALRKKRATLQAKMEKAAAGTDVKSWWNALEADPDFDHPVPVKGLTVYLPLAEVKEGKTTATVWGKDIEVDVGKAVPAKKHPHGQRGVRFPEKGGMEIPVENLFTPASEVTFSYWLRTPDRVLGQDMLRLDHPGDPKKKLPKTGWAISGGDRGNLTLSIFDEKGTQLRNLMPAETPLIPRSWQHIAVRYSGGLASSSITFYVNGERRHGRRNADALAKSEKFGEHLPAILKVGNSAPTGGISDLRIYSRALSPEEIGLLANEFEIRRLVAGKPAFAELDETQQALVSDLHLLRYNPAVVAATREKMATQRRHDFLYARNPTTQVYQEGSGEAMAHVLVRGEYDNRGDAVAAGVPEVFPALEGDSLDRLDLAKWLMQPDHPMTARVTVNRLWQSVFGTGIVKTAGDFGIMGEKPTHPELLDFLARRFIESGWDVKAMLRLMVTSAAYRQSAERSPEMLAADPENRFYSAGPRRRLDAEVIRDQALAVSGILDRSIGGESVKPYQPPGVWKPVAFAGSNTREFKQDPLEKIHRRSVYTFWKRTAHHPALAAFNAPNREECSVVRERTNTPLQALVLLNDVQHVEAARVLAEAMVKKGGNLDERLEEAFLRVVGHPASADDHTDLKALLEMARNQYGSDADAAKKLHDTGDLPHDESLDSVEVASWTLLINTLMNRDDVINQS